MPQQELKFTNACRDADQYMHLRDFSSAARAWGKIRGQWPNRHQGYVRGAYAAMESGEFAQAETLSKEAIQKAPTAIEPYFAYFDACMRQRKFNCASEVAATLMGMFPKHPQSYAKSALAYLEEHRYEDAEKVCQEGMQNVPERPDVWNMYAEVSMRQRRFGEARQRFAVSLEKFPVQPAAYARAAMAWMEENKYGEAEDLCKLGMEKAGGWIESWSAYAEVAMRQRKFEEALIRWERCRAKFPTFPFPYTRAAFACLELNDDESALEFCRMGMIMAPNWMDAWNLHADLAMRSRDFKTAQDRCGELIKRFPLLSLGYAKAAYAHMEMGNFDAADHMCEIGIKKSPFQIDSYIAHAEILMRKARYEEAQPRWQKIRQQFPFHPAGYARGARAYGNAHKYAEAEELCCQGIQGNRMNAIRREWHTELYRDILHPSLPVFGALACSVCLADF